MLKSLKFVQGAVSKKDFIPAMTHFNIKDCKITAYNGTFAISSPIDCNIDCNPDATSLIKAISKCSESTQLSLTNGGKLSIKSGSFRALVPCHPDQLPEFLPSGSMMEIDGKLLYGTFSELYDFIGNDATRPWSNGILIKDKSAFATNNIILVEKWLGNEFPFIANVPRLAIREILRIKEDPILVQVDENSITFHYKNDRYIKTQQLDSNWPNVFNILNINDIHYTDINEDLFTGIETLKDFSDNLQTIYFQNDYLSTSKIEDDGAFYNTVNSPGIGCYSLTMLLKLKGVADKIDWSKYPKPCPFIGNNLRGIIVGMRE